MGLIYFLFSNELGTLYSYLDLEVGLFYASAPAMDVDGGVMFSGCPSVKHSFGLKDEPIRCWWSKVTVTH